MAMTNSPLSFPHATPPVAGTVLEVAPGIRWLRMPLPFALDHINLYLLADGDAWTTIDTGITLPAVQTAWQQILAEHPLKRLLVTHFHPDHLGLADWLQQATGAPLWITQGEYLTGQMVQRQIGGYGGAAMIEFFRLHGLDEQRCQALDQRGNAYGRGVPSIPATFRRIWPGEVITVGQHGWQVIIGHGHSAEHASLYCREAGVLISGDMLLPRSSTNISVFAVTPEANPLAAFLNSLESFRALPEDTLVLPSHGLPFRGMHARIEQLKAHHVARCDDLLAACATQAKSAAELIPVLFSRDIPDAHQTMFAMGEAIAHLNYLEQARRLERVTENGVIRFIQNR